MFKKSTKKSKFFLSCLDILLKKKLFLLNGGFICSRTKKAHQTLEKQGLECVEKLSSVNKTKPPFFLRQRTLFGQKHVSMQKKSVFFPHKQNTNNKSILFNKKGLIY